LLLHLFGSVSGEHRDDDNLGVGDVGVGLDLQLLQREDADPD
jgi:hypothetical protein